MDAQAVTPPSNPRRRTFSASRCLAASRKAPKELVLKKYEKDIQDEVKRKLIGDSYRKTIGEEN